MEKDSYPVNEHIRARKVQVISEEGKNLGVLDIKEALNMAYSKGLDLVQVASKEIPVCRIMDYRKFLYQREKKMRDVLKQQRKSAPKEIKLRIRIGPKDLETKMTRLREFLDEGRKVRVVVELRGWREMVHQKQGYELLEQIKQHFLPRAHLEIDIRRDGRRIYMILAPKKGAKEYGTKNENP
ncbi:MAG: translation initiation factor IF-3 [bacterium JZ-2024 1]